MADITVGILAILIGLGFALRGYLAMRVIIPLWGAMAGFFLGAGLFESIAGEGFLRSVLAWVVSLVLAVLFGVLAYLYYEVCVVLAMSAIGFVIGTSLTAALGVTWSWLIILVGVAAGVLLAFFAIVADLPMAILTVLTALAGAGLTVTGALLVFGTIDLEELGSGVTTQRISDEWWWYAVYAGVAVVGIVSQMASTTRLEASLRDSWSASGGRHLSNTGAV
jgi:Domain of unknown function (DUF4203)